jgi:3-oxoacyl-[acyl-carrier-protein] synthase II
MNRRIVITGLGVICPGAIGTHQLWERIRLGQSAVGTISRFDPTLLPSKIAAEVTDFHPDDFIEKRMSRRMERSGLFAVAAALMAWEDARIVSRVNSERVGVYEGTSLGPIVSLFDQHKKFLAEGCKRVDPTMLISSMTGVGSGNIALALQAHGPCTTISDGSASSTCAVGMGYRQIKKNEIDIAIAGGSEAPLCAEIVSTFCCARVLSTQNDKPMEAMKPFDRDRDGFVLGEGAAILILEELTHALRRNATIHAELAGFGETTDAYHPTTPQPDGAWITRAMEIALRESSTQPQQIDYVNVHGTATLANDRAETLALKRMFDGYSSNVPVSSTKPITGHLLGACGALEAVITTLAIRNQFLPPTINLQNQEEEFNLDYIAQTGRASTIEHALTNNYSFSGRNASLLLKKFSEREFSNTNV